MDVSGKLRILADAAKYDASCASSGGKRKRTEGGIGNAEGMGICHSYTPDGRCVSLLKILLTNFCMYDCLFCVNRSSSDTPRARFSVKEVVKLTLDFYRRNYIEGLFLSSGIIQSPDYTMEAIVRVAKTLRLEHRFCGYIHLKTIPHASKELVAEAGRYADRLSINIELPSQHDLDQLAPAKQHAVIESAMAAIKRERENASQQSEHLLSAQEGPYGIASETSAEASAAPPRRERPERSTKRQRQFARAGQSTQLVVGATPSTDAEILGMSANLYQKYALRRVYYSAFSPIPFSAPGVPVVAAPLIREHRLYQADWLFRFYGFTHSEIVAPAEPNLDLTIDPKLGWAFRNRAIFPVDVNSATREMLLRIPGFGVRTVQRILQARRFGRLRFDDLVRMRVPMIRAKHFIILDDWKPLLVGSADPERFRAVVAGANHVQTTQLSLFEPRVAESFQSAVSGEL